MITQQQKIMVALRYVILSIVPADREISIQDLVATILAEAELRGMQAKQQTATSIGDALAELTYQSALVESNPESTPTEIAFKRGPAFDYWGNSYGATLKSFVDTDCPCPDHTAARETPTTSAGKSLLH